MSEVNLDEVNFKPVSGLAAGYIKGRILAEAGITGEVLIGTFKSSDENEYGKSYAFTLAKDVTLGDIEAKAGSTLVMNGCSTLDRQMAEVDQGSLVQVIYEGMKQGKKNTFHAFTVNVAS